MTLEEILAELPAWSRWGQREGLILDPVPDRTPGSKYCRWCRTTAIPKRRQSWCSDACVNRYLAIGSWNALRERIRERDGERCRECGTLEPGWRRGIRGQFMFMEAQDINGVPYRGYTSRLQPAWEIDHIIPVALGGTDDPENLRLLCGTCHGIKTAKDTAMIAKGKRIKARHEQIGRARARSPRRW